MNVKVVNQDDQHSFELRDGSNVLILIRELGLYPDGVLVFRDGQVIPDDTLLHEADVLEIIRISSGG